MVSYYARISATRGQLLGGTNLQLSSRFGRFEDADNFSRTACGINAHACPTYRVVESKRYPDIFVHCGVETASIDGACPGCKAIMTIEDARAAGERVGPQGWDIFNAAKIDPEGIVWFEIQRDDESDRYDDDETAAHAHFAIVDTDNDGIIWARVPKTGESQARVAEYLERMRAALRALSPQ